MTKSKRRRGKSSSASPAAPPLGSPARPAASGRSSTRARRLLVAALGLICLLVVALFWRPWLVMVSNQQAQLRLAAHQYDQARQWLARSVKLDEHEAETHFLLARLHRKLGDASQFERHLVRAAELGADHDRCRAEQRLAQAQTGQLRGVEAWYAELLEDPRIDAAEVCEAFANGYLVSGRFQQAMRILEGWQTADPLDGQPHYMQGLVWRHLRNFQKAESALRETLRLAPDHGSAALELAELLDERGRIEEALPFYRQAALEPTLRQRAVVGEAGVVWKLGQSDQAREALQGVLLQDPTDASALALLGRLELSAGRTAEAEKLLREAHAQRPRDVELRYSMATALSAAGKKDEAEGHYQAVAEARPALERARETMIRINDQPDDVAGRTEIGQTLLQFGQPEDGLIWLQSALEIDATYAPAHRALADYFEGPGQGQPRASELALFHRQQAVGGGNAGNDP